MRLSIPTLYLVLLCFVFVVVYEESVLYEMLQEQTEEDHETEQARTYYELYEHIWQDLVYFPVPESLEQKNATVTYENSWLFERTYGGSYGHEGTDLMADINKSGYYPILSISDGIVEKIGWLEKGGWRIGIRSPHDVYFYYAHLDSYAEDLKSGDVIKAGQLLGYMGDTGYGTVEGTRGKLPVHLHLGIYVRSETVSELAVNPYWFLKYLENHKLTVSF